MKVALVYDRINKWGGAERVLLALHELFPEAPLYTSVYNKKVAPWADVFPKVIPSFLQDLPFAKTRHDFYAPLMPLAFESFDFSEYDLVISVTSEAAKGIITKPGTLHICYCLTPTRYLWSGYEEYFKNFLLRYFSRPAVAYLRMWDRVAAQRPDVMLAISHNVASRIQRFYGRDSQVIYPPVEIAGHEALRGNEARIGNVRRNTPHETSLVAVKRPYFLVVSRLVPYKRVDLVIEVFNRLKLSLVVVGTGSEEKSLRERSESKSTVFVGQVNDEELVSYYRGCKALIFPQEEDFGITAVEAQAFGKPVIAYRAGGALETVVRGATGIFFEHQTPESLTAAIRKFSNKNFDERTIKENAKKFSREKFFEEFGKLISATAKQK